MTANSGELIPPLPPPPPGTLGVPGGDPPPASLIVPPSAEAAPVEAVMSEGSTGLGLAALVLGVAAVLTSAVVVGLFFGVAAVVLGVASRGRSGSQQRTRSWATAAIVLGVAGVVLGIGFGLVYAIVRADSGADTSTPAATSALTPAPVDTVMLTRCDVVDGRRAKAAGTFRDPSGSGATHVVRVVFLRDGAVIGTATATVVGEPGDAISAGSADFEVETVVDGTGALTCAVDGIYRR